MKIRIGFVSNSSSSSYIAAVKVGEKCPHCGRSDINLLDLIERIDGEYEETRLRARGYKQVDAFYTKRMQENGYDPTKKLPDPEACPACGAAMPPIIIEDKSNPMRYQVMCTQCKAHGPAASSREQARKNWDKFVGGKDNKVDEWELSWLETLHKIRTEGKKLEEAGYELAFFEISYHDPVIAELLDMGKKSGNIVVFDRDA